MSTDKPACRASVRPATVLLGIVAAALLAGQIVVAQGPGGDTGVARLSLMRQILNPGVAPAGEHGAVRGKGDDGRALGGTLPPSAGLIINATFDSTITSDPNAAAIENAINTAIANIQSKFSDPVIVAITFAEMGSGLGQSDTYIQNVSYSTFLAALKADAKTPDDFTAIALLPNASTNPVNGSSTIDAKLANLRAVGISATPPPGQPDSTISLNTMITSPGSPGSPGDYNLTVTAEHEIDEVLGLGSSLPNQASLFNTILPEDLFRYDQTGARTWTTTSTVFAFFSIDDMHALDQFDNQNDGGDFGDWQSNPRPAGVPPQVQDAFATPNADPALGVELRALDVIGYDRVGTSPRRSTPGDFDGDGKTDPATYYPSVGQWWMLYSGTDYATNSGPVDWGGGGGTPVPGDYDGDGKTDPALYFPATGQWWILYSSTHYATNSGPVSWGGGGALPVPGDYDGDGKTDPALYFPATGQWWILYSSTGYKTNSGPVSWGGGGAIPEPGDYDGDGKADPALYFPATGQWWILYSSTHYATNSGPVTWGGGGSIPEPGDYDGDGKTDPAVYFPSIGQWWILYSSTGYSTSSGPVNWGAAGATPVPGDYDGDGKTDPALYFPSVGQWWILYSSTHYTTNSGPVNWGGAGATPINEP